MYYFWTALVCAIVGTLPLLIGRRFISMIVQGTTSFVFLWWIFYGSVISTVWPLFGFPGLFILLLWSISIIVAQVTKGDDDDRPVLYILPAVIGVVLYLGSFFLGSGFMRTDDYEKMIGTVETRTWTQDIQPKDPKHMRMSTKDNAIYLAQKAIGQDGMIGSQFQTEDDEFTLQMVNGELWYVAPLEFKGYAAWSGTHTSPGYVMVSAENSDVQPKLVLFPNGQRMRYSPSAYFGDDLERHLRQNGYLDKGLTDFSFEVDENQHAWWVVTVFEPTIMWDGEKVKGVVIVDPATGDNKFYALGSVPSWVDRVVPQDYVENYLAWWGEYRHGWWNEVWTEQDITKPGDSSLIYGSGDEPEWVTDITSSNSKSNSLIGVVYTSSRTGKSVFYKIPGGATNQGVLDVVNNNPQINFHKLHGADPQLYNVYGSMASVVPLFNDNHSFQGVAIVSIENVQKVATGVNQYEALREYEKQLSESGEKTALGKDRVLKVKDGIVDRIHSDVTTSGSIYYFHLGGVPHLFVGGSSDSPKLPVTEKGDRVRVEYYDSVRDVVPVHSFANNSLPLSEGVDQKEVRATVLQDRVSQETAEDAHTVRDEINNLTPGQLQQLKAHLQLKQEPK
jgi:hypothetical protein